MFSVSRVSGFGVLSLKLNLCWTLSPLWFLVNLKGFPTNRYTVASRPRGLCVLASSFRLALSVIGALKHLCIECFVLSKKWISLSCTMNNRPSHSIQSPSTRSTSWSDVHLLSTRLQLGTAIVWLRALSRVSLTVFVLGLFYIA